MEPEWYVCTFFFASRGVTDCSRLLELAPSYFDISTFPEGETKWALQRVANIQSNGMPAATGFVRNILKGLNFF